MFCTTECWDCEDKSCKYYISKSTLYFENTKLKEENKDIIQLKSRVRMLESLVYRLFKGEELSTGQMSEVVRICELKEQK